MGASTLFSVTVRGKGGHAAMPHTIVDPVVAGAAIVTALQVKSLDWVHVGVGTIMGAAAQFNVTVRGKGGHAAMPHTTVDPVVAGAAIVTALQVKLSNMHATLDAL